MQNKTIYDQTQVPASSLLHNSTSTRNWNSSRATMPEIYIFAKNQKFLIRTNYPPRTPFHETPRVCTLCKYFESRNDQL